MTCSSSIKYGLHRILFTVEIIVVSVLLLAMVAAVSSQSTSSPCPNIFNYQYNSDTGEYLGLIQVPSPPLGSTLHLVVNLTLNARLPTVSLHSSCTTEMMRCCDIPGDDLRIVFQSIRSGGGCCIPSSSWPPFL